MTVYVKDTRTGYKVPLVQGDVAVTAHEAAGDPHPQYLTESSEEIKINLSNDGSVLDTGRCDSFYPLANTSTITGWYITATPSGSLQVDILKAAASIPEEYNSITNGNYVTVNSGTYNSDTDLSDWTSTTLNAGDVLGVNIISATNVQKAVITMRVQR